MKPQANGPSAERQGPAHFHAVKQRVEPVQRLNPFRQGGYWKIQSAEQEKGHDDQRDVVVEMIDVFDGAGVGDR